MPDSNKYTEEPFAIVRSLTKVSKYCFKLGTHWPIAKVHYVGF